MIPSTPRARLYARVVGVLQLLLAVVGAQGAAFLFGRLSQEDAQNPLWAMRQAPAQFQQLLVLGTTLELSAAVLALVSGLALLGLRSWAWRATAAFCVVRIAGAGVQGFNFYFNMLKPHLLALEEATRSRAPSEVWLQPMVPFALAMIYPVLLLAGLWFARMRSTSRPPARVPPNPRPASAGRKPKDVATAVRRHPTTGALEVRITATGTAFAVMSQAVLNAVMELYTRYSGRDDFDGQMTIVVLRETPDAVRASLPSLKEKLRGVSFGSMAQGGKVLRFLVQEEGTAGELVSGSDLLKDR